jgi:hypothetical protein
MHYADKHADEYLIGCGSKGLNMERALDGTRVKLAVVGVGYWGQNLAVIFMNSAP